MKGMALEKQKKKPEAIAIFRDVVKKYPHSDQAPEATAQLHSLGATTIAGPTKKSPAR
jgi:TolA-binding protein